MKNFFMNGCESRPLRSTIPDGCFKCALVAIHENSGLTGRIFAHLWHHGKSCEFCPNRGANTFFHMLLYYNNSWSLFKAVFRELYYYQEQPQERQQQLRCKN